MRKKGSVGTKGDREACKPIVCPPPPPPKQPQIPSGGTIQVDVDAGFLSRMRSSPSRVTVDVFVRVSPRIQNPRSVRSVKVRDIVANPSQTQTLDSGTRRLSFKFEVSKNVRGRHYLMLIMSAGDIRDVRYFVVVGN